MSEWKHYTDAELEAMPIDTLDRHGLEAAAACLTARADYTRADDYRALVARVLYRRLRQPATNPCP